MTPCFICQETEATQDKQFVKMKSSKLPFVWFMFPISPEDIFCGLELGREAKFWMDETPKLGKPTLHNKF